ncbi:hypothetical protein LUW76_32995 [Actinomadura madurae]|nr:hypothetical protein [Actinomadura madurae]URN01916.1 hypothetical protein LUW76_32995 [Actinomadura madurae]
MRARVLGAAGREALAVVVREAGPGEGEGHAEDGERAEQGGALDAELP